MFKAIIPNLKDKGVILVKGIPFGGPDMKDVHGQYFTPRTNFLSHILPFPPVFHFHGSKSGSLTTPLGETLSREQKNDGVWYKVKLFLESSDQAVRSKATQLWDAAKAGKLFASSGAVEATIKIDTSGEILQWLVGELSLIDSRNSRERPASFHATVIPVKADLENIETSDVNITNLKLPEDNNDSDDSEEWEMLQVGDYIENVYHQIIEAGPADPNELRNIMLGAYRSMFDAELDIEEKPTTRSQKMADDNKDLLAQMQAQIAELTSKISNLNVEVQTRDQRISELQTAITTKSAEVAMSAHVALVEKWIQDGKITPAEREKALDVLSFAYRADSSTKDGDTGFVSSIKAWIEVRPTNPVLGEPSAIFTNLNGSGQLNNGLGGGVDPANIARLKRYAEIK